METCKAGIGEYQKTTFPFTTRPVGVEQPNSTVEVQEIVRKANSSKQKIHTISTGKNWGYGDKLSAEDNCLILDLSSMNQILEVNDKLGYAVIEPGVTQGDLHQYLEQQGIPLWIDGNGSGPDTSIIGNYLERGFGHTPLGERCKNVATMEIVLGNGEILNTGLNTKDKPQPADFTYNNGVGPDLSGLFFQSNFGIVTKMTIWLMPKPKSFSAFYVGANSDAEMFQLVEKIGELRREGVLKSSVHIGNAIRSLINSVDYPWNDSTKRSALPQAYWQKIANNNSMSLWNGTGGIYGDSKFVTSSMEIIQKRLEKFSFQYIDDKDPNPVIQNAIGLLMGRPSSAYLRSAAWRSKTAVPGEMDPITNNAGLLWFAPILPATPKDLKLTLDRIKQIYASYQFDLPITLTFVNDRSLIATTNISFDRSNPVEGAEAWDCLQELISKLTEAGYPPYRLPVTINLKRNENYSAILNQLKRVFDPNEILSPKRYI